MLPRSANFLAHALVHLEQIQDYVNSARDELCIELAPLAARPDSFVLCQKKDPTRRAHENGFTILRTGGDLVLRRGNLVGATLSLKTLLTFADAIPIEDGTRVFLVGNDEISAFFKQALPASERTWCVRLDVHVRNATRHYTLPREFVPMLQYSGRTPEHAKEVLALAATVSKETTRLMTLVRTIGEKRKRVEAYEATWLDEKDASATKKARKE